MNVNVHLEIDFVDPLNVCANKTLRGTYMTLCNTDIFYRGPDTQPTNTTQETERSCHNQSKVERHWLQLQSICTFISGKIGETDYNQRKKVP